MSAIESPSGGDLRRQDVWTDRFTLPYESAFSLLQKYMWANTANSHEVARNLIGRGPLLGRRRDTYELLKGDWIAHGGSSIPKGMDLRDGLLSHYGLRWPARLARWQHLRFCVPCLEEGYHAVFFQLEVLKHCPLHRTPFTTLCQRCGEASPPLVLRAGNASVPFQCDRCEGALVQRLDPKRWFANRERHQAVKVAFAPIAEWIERLERDFPQPPSEAPPLGQLHLLQANSNDSDEAVCGDLALRLTPLAISAHCLGELERPLSYRFVRVRKRSERMRHARPLSEAVKSRYAIVKSIRRYLSRTRLRAHRSCIREALTSVYFHNSKLGAAVLQDLNICPLAAAFTRWIHNYTWQTRHLRDGDQIGIAGTNPDDAADTLWALDVLSEFYSSAVTTAAFNRFQSAGIDAQLSTADYQQIQPHCTLPRVGTSCWGVKHHVESPNCTVYFVAHADQRCIEILREALAAESKCSSRKYKPRAYVSVV